MGAQDANGGHAQNWMVAWIKRSPGRPILSKATPIIHDERVVNQPDRIRYSDFHMTTLTNVVQFPGDPDMVGEWIYPSAPLRALPRNKSFVHGELLVPPPTIPQTVSNRRRAQLASMDEVPAARLDIFEGVI
jgi:hypothetical protein